MIGTNSHQSTPFTREGNPRKFGSHQAVKLPAITTFFTTRLKQNEAKSACAESQIQKIKTLR